MKLRWIVFLLFLSTFTFVLEWDEIERTEQVQYQRTLKYQTELIYNQFQKNDLSELHQSDFSRLNDQTECLILLDEDSHLIYSEGFNANIYLEQWKSGKLTGLSLRYAFKILAYQGSLYQLLIVFKPLSLLKNAGFKNLILKLALFHFVGVSLLILLLLIRLLEPLVFLERFTRGGFFHKEEFDRERPLTRLMSKEVRNTFLHIEEIRNHFKIYEEKVKSIHRSNVALSDRMNQITTKEIHELDLKNLALNQLNHQLLSDLEMAKRVQIGMIPNPTSLEHRNEFRVGMTYTPMESLGGDLVDIIRVGRNGYAFLIADVSGHGVAAALITTMAKVSFNDHSGWHHYPGEICEKINNELCRLIGNLGYYLTAFYGILNLEDSSFVYTNAGHPSALFYHKKTHQLSLLCGTGTILGVFDDMKYREKKVKLQCGDRILFYTDGIVETANEKDELYGVNRISEFFQKRSDIDIQEVLEQLTEEIDKFSNYRPAQDDRAVLIIEYVSPYVKPKIARSAGH